MNANPYLIGADPEFAILDSQGRYLAADLPQGKLGTDHGGRVVELRPDPSFLASALCEDMRKTLNRRELVPYRKYLWKAGAVAGPESNAMPLGGHIHFDIPFQRQRDDVLTNNCLRALNRVATWFDGLEFFPKGEAVLRQRLGYGRISEDIYNDQTVRPAGRRPDGLSRLEYRTPPSWLYSPDLSFLALTTFKLALVDPQHTLDSLPQGATAPMTRLRRFIAGFAKVDSDAAEITQRIEADGNRLRQFRGDPAGDLKLAWKIPPVETLSEPATSEATPFPGGIDTRQIYFNREQLDNLRMQMNIPHRVDS